ncbi:MAG: hypothetical protein AAB887_01090 [Patescibacteria group bacterium]
MDPLNNVDAKIQKEPLLQQVLKEIGIANQESDKVKSEMILKHKNLIPQYEEKEKRKLIVYIAKIGNQKSAINTDDIAPIGSMLASCGSVENLDLMIHSPGGSGVTAEKIVEMCRKYTTKEFRVIVPNMAKSAATIIALGADKIVMGYCSELGPIDAQKFINVGGITQQLSAQSFISARENLLKELAKAKAEKKEFIGYLQQLSSSTVEPAFIEECKRELNFAVDLVKKWLPQYMLKAKNPSWNSRKLKQTANTIAKNLSSADKRFVHGRMIGPDESDQLGLGITKLEKEDPIWNLLWEIYLRSEIFLMVNSNPQQQASKLFFDNQNFLFAF